MGKKKAKKLPKTFVVFILDKSGSMNSIRKETIDGFNSNVQHTKMEAAKAQRDTIVCLTTFSAAVSFDQVAVKADEVKELTWETYVPQTTTALFDAVGATIEKVSALPGIDDKDSTVLCIIISDGIENDSKKFNSETIAKLVREKQALGNWTFTYLGAEQDLSQVEKQLGIPAGNIQAFARTDAGVKMSTHQRNSGLTAYFTSISNPVAQVRSVSSFYGTSNNATPDNGAGI